MKKIILLFFMLSMLTGCGGYRDSTFCNESLSNTVLRKEMEISELPNGAKVIEQNAGSGFSVIKWKENYFIVQVYRVYGGYLIYDLTPILYQEE